MRWPRPTTRRIMALVAVLAAGLGLVVPAAQVACDKDEHVHVWFDDRPWPPPGTWIPAPPGGARMALMQQDVRARPPFWPRYWRRLLGRPWRGQPVCPADPGRSGETCSFRPEVPLAGPEVAARGAP